MRKRAILLFFVFFPFAALAQSARDNADDAGRLVKALDLRAGSVVGEIGAGSGELTVLLAKAVGETGRVFSNELNAERRAEIASAAAAAGLKNVVIVEGAPADANLPEGCCDAVFMRNVYHHFADPPSMNGSLFRAVKPGGRIAVMDFAPSGTESETPAGRAEQTHHGVSAASVARELRAAGFIDDTSEHVRGGMFIVVARRPSTP
ncbi:MAG: hypothetical protein DMF86_11515 [Acidobacteria bacterium]|nr:MAG: hypothetical protein DMF86_11515 [Acidobacteriota bacterium]